MLYSADDLGTLTNPEVKLTSEELLVTSRLRELVGNKFEDSRELELLASVWYMTPKGKISAHDKARLLVSLEELKPQFKQSELSRAWRRFSNSGRN